MTTKKMDVDSIVNQRIKERFVEREVKALFSYEMEAILRASAEGKGGADMKDYPLPTYEEIENLDTYICHECGHGEADVTEFHKEGYEYACPNCGKKLDEEPESAMQEIFEWWIVTEYLYEKLKAKGCPVLEWCSNYYWGRCATG